MSYSNLQGHFQRSALPLPLDYYPQHLPKLLVRGQWAQTYCPFHKNGQEKHPSLSVNLVEGYFRCFACGIKGSDVLSFHRQYYQLDFKSAAQELGAWLEGGAHYA